MLRKIELAKVRDFGEVINDTFAFLKQNFKTLIKHIFIFSGIFLAGTVICGTIYQMQLYKNTGTEGIAPANSNVFNTPASQIYFWISLALNGLFLLLGYFVMLITVISYMALYKAKGNTPPSAEEMWGYIKYYIWRTVLAAIVSGILIVVGFVFCIIPSIYLSTVLVLFVPIIIIENGSFNYSFGRSFSLIKDHWWATFGVIVVTSIIVSIASGITSLPSTIVPFTLGFVHIGFGSPGYIAITAFTMAIKGLSSLFQLIPMIATGLIYFNLVERKEGTSLLDKIAAIGTETTPEEPEDAGEEQY